jgi:hypothetical protein
MSKDCRVQIHVFVSRTDAGLIYFLGEKDKNRRIMPVDCCVTVVSQDVRPVNQYFMHLGSLIDNITIY